MLIDATDLVDRAQVLSDECWRLRNVMMAGVGGPGPAPSYDELTRALTAAQLMAEQIVWRAARAAA